MTNRPANAESRSNDSSSSGVSRRQLLGASATVGTTAATAGCLGTGSDESTIAGVYVFNTSDMTVSVIDADSDELVTTQYLGATSSWPENHHAITNPDLKTLWLNVRGGVMGYAPDTLSQQANVDTGSDKNWPALTPDGTRLAVAVREPEHKYVRIDADRNSDTFGQITAEIDRDEAAPCDMTIGPNGEYAYVPDRGADRLTVLRVDPFEVVTAVELDPIKPVDAVRPYMCTVSWDGRYLALENQEGEHNTESIFDVSDPENPEEVTRLTQEDGLGRSPVSSEFDADSNTAYLFTVDSESVTVVDLDGMEVRKQIDLGGAAWTGSLGPAREKLYVAVVNNDEIAVIDLESDELTETISVGGSPRGVTARRDVRPPSDDVARIQAAMASFGVTFGSVETTYCDGECRCGEMCHNT